MELLIAIFDRPYEPGAGETGLRSQQLVEEAARAVEEAEEAGTSFYFVIQVVEWVFLGVIALFFLLLLARALRRFLSAGPKNTDGDRESVKEDANPVTDIAGACEEVDTRVDKKTRAQAELQAPGRSARRRGCPAGLLRSPHSGRGQGPSQAPGRDRR